MSHERDDAVAALTNGDFTERTDPWALFTEWFEQAQGSEPEDPNAMTLATAGRDGLPDARIVLLKGLDAQGFVFYTNSRSAKGLELAENPQAALLFHWKSLRRQVRVRGAVGRVEDAEADAYFATRPRDSRIGAWASRQSEPLESRGALERAVAEAAARFGEDEVPRPPHWTGFRVTPVTIEFWQNGDFRLHDRVRFTRAGEGWERSRLFP
ncbi:pyridoxamine 5'-phosphate oxidase [Methylobacterium sp. 4-46]|uniref:pyridoxamine 5'-phosphate oxidase n=1 Tax=unclassified Methylobacterium TaxID=2615210 RepID=UPI000165C7E0|nr:MULTISPECIES: pyridoxamine 5'-phosphate oxidase [Methylobacterium]ACA16562.1 pyridoxamine 5'-phosphate oxidase [Methylobacterium sp. 4-46]WFT82271.1 pyridoxamine 5'-phosphate oxidase [Methylobacterium nodulans]